MSGNNITQRQLIQADVTNQQNVTFIATINAKSLSKSKRMSYPPPRLRIISRASTTLLKLQLTTAPAKQYHVSPNDHSCRKSRECEYAFLPLRLFRRFNGINQILGWQVSYSSVDGEFLVLGRGRNSMLDGSCNSELKKMKLECRLFQKPL